VHPRDSLRWSRGNSALSLFIIDQMFQRELIFTAAGDSTGVSNPNLPDKNDDGSTG